MAKPFIFILLCFLSLLNFTNAQLFSASHSSLGLTINVIVDTNTDMVDVTITGPKDNWWAYGFGSTGMNNTYTVSTNADGSFAERKLGDFAAGILLAPTIMANVTDDGSTRTLQFTRDRVGATSDYFTFPNTITTVPIIFANPPGISNFSYHGSGNQVKENDAMGLIFSEVLPVSWSDFNLINSDGGVLINWITEKEVGNNGFYVQRSNDGKKWEDVTFLDAKDPNGSEYQYVDKRALPGVNYYRLKQVDLAGGINYSVIKSIGIGRRKINSDINFYPNPVTDVVNLDLPESDGKVRIQIRNVNNALLFDKIWEDMQSMTINVSPFPTGHYYISLQAKDWAFTKYFIKQ